MCCDAEPEAPNPNEASPGVASDARVSSSQPVVPTQAAAALSAKARSSASLMARRFASALRLATIDPTAVTFWSFFTFS